MGHLKPWREIAVPHKDVLKGTFQQAEFAADISRVHEGSATEEYQNPELFYQRTFITEGMKLLLDSVVKRISGQGGDPVIQLQTAFGGGKTHTMLAVYHMAKGEVDASRLQGISPILDTAGITELPKARVAVLDGVRLSPNQPQKREGITAHTIWGELAWQLGGESAYEMVKDADLSGTSPGKEVLTKLISSHAPCIILIDELVAYVRQFEEGKSFTGGSFDSNLSFIQALTEALKAVPTAVLLASLPESDKEAGSQRGARALATLAHYFGRVQALWKPVATEEAFEIVRRRLFTDIGDRMAADDVCRAYADFYAANSGDFPPETRESHYLERIQHAYPIHPEVFDRLYDDWSSLDNFQRTRGVLKLMAKVIHRLWKDGNNDLLIQPASLPLYDPDTRNESIYYLPQGWDPVLEKDIDGERSTTSDLDSTKPIFGSIQACRRLARTIFLGSAPDAGTVGGSKHHRGLELERLLLGCTQPGQVVGHYKDGIRAITDRLQYLNSANNRFWFDTRPNLRREMEDRKRRFTDIEDVFPMIRDKLRFPQSIFGGLHIFTASSDVPDDSALRLVILAPDATFGRNGQGTAIDKASEVLKQRGEQPRQKQNRLIFLAADVDTVSRLKDQVRSVLAWQSIVADVRDSRLNLDQIQSKQASRSLEESIEALGRMIKESYKWLLAPMQQARPGKGISEIEWEHFQLNPASPNRVQEIERILKENELLIAQWAPVHLHNLLKTWFWKEEKPEVNALEVWQKSCCYIYMPRLLNEDVFRNTLTAGEESRDFFGVAQGKEEDKYVGFCFGGHASIFLDSALLLIEPSTAAEYDAALKADEQRKLDNEKPDAGGAGTVETPPTPGGDPSGGTSAVSTDPKQSKRRFYGTISLNPISAKMDFSNIMDEVVQQFSSKYGVNVRISVEIDAESREGFDDALQRAVKENCNVLKFGNAEFE